MRGSSIAVLSNVAVRNVSGASTTVITPGDGKLTVESLAPISGITITAGDTKLIVGNA